MRTITFIVLILLSLVGYSAAVTVKCRKEAELRPEISDLILIAIIWTGAIYTGIISDFNKWLMILAWVSLGIMIGMLSPKRHESLEEASNKENPVGSLKNSTQTIWQRWKIFSKKMSGFQSRIILSFFFFIFVSPTALIVKLFSDPLKIKSQIGKSNWLPKKDVELDLEHFRRQF